MDKSVIDTVLLDINLIYNIHSSYRLHFQPLSSVLCPDRDDYKIDFFVSFQRVILQIIVLFA